jgi:hypothetical protein
MVLAWLGNQLLVRPDGSVDWARDVWVELCQWLLVESSR